MQGVVYVFIGLGSLALGAAGYFALALTPVESAMLAAILAIGACLVHERQLRRRAERRLEKGVHELGRLLSTDAQAGQVLSQRVNALTDLDIGARLEVIEADMSVLGTVVRQVAEAVSDLETAQASAHPSASDESDEPQPVTRRPTIAIETVRQALDDGLLVFHAQPIVTLPQRKVHAYDLVMRLRLENGRLADPPDYLPVRNREGEFVLRRIERILLDEGTKIVRRGRMSGDPVSLMIDLSPASLSDKGAVDQLIGLLSANRAVNPDLCFAIDHGEWSALTRSENDMLDRLVQQGAGVSLRNVYSLRLDFGAIAARGVRYLGVDVSGFLNNPAQLSDFHSADINDYIKRFGINLVMTGVSSEDQILALLDDGIKLAQGNAIASVAPLRQDLRGDSGDEDLMRAASR